jgi:alpha-amylase
MPSVCFYFQVHQPYRIKRLSKFDSLEPGEYFDSTLNREIMRKVAAKCYLPTNHLMLELIHRYGKSFRISYSISGITLEQMSAYAPEALESFQKLAATGCVEFLNETYYHSLSALWPSQEFEQQVQQHRDIIKKTFSYDTKVFRNTELIYSDLIGHRLAPLGFTGVLAEGADDILGWRSANWVYNSPIAPIKLLLKNYSLSDDIAFRFSNRGWREWPLTAPKFASWIKKISGAGDILNLFMDYETFGEHQWEEHGIFPFLEHLPEAIFSLGDWDFATPSEVFERYPSRESISYSRLVSWADVERDISAWLENEMQSAAFERLKSLESIVKSSQSPELIDIWRRLQTSDHFYYMCTKWFADGDVHAYFSPYQSPYDAFVYYQTALKHFADSFIPPQLNLEKRNDKFERGTKSLLH